ncbi:MAG: hypothetical protein ACRC37_03235, partial [Lentisphaeria bacterium]
NILPVRVYSADNADCSNLMRASNPTIFACDLNKLTNNQNFLPPFHAAVDTNSLTWIMKKSPGDILHYPLGKITIHHLMRASVFQAGLLINLNDFELLFPQIQGYQFFLIKDQNTAEICQQLFEPYGLILQPTHQFMAQAEIFQNRYLSIFLQLASLGFILGIASLMLLIARNIHSQHNNISLMQQLNIPKKTITKIFLIENFAIYLSSSIISICLLALLACITTLHIPTLIISFLCLFSIGSTLIYCQILHSIQKSIKS